MALNSAINKCLPSQKSLQHQTSSDRINPPVVRQASHTFTKHPLYKDAKVFGYWLNGKLHGGYVIVHGIIFIQFYVPFKIISAHMRRANYKEL